MATATKKNTEVTIKTLIVAAICQAYWLQSEKLKLLPRLRKQVESERLGECIERNTEDTEQSVNRIESACVGLDAKPKRTAIPLYNLAAVKDDPNLKLKNRNLRDAAIIALLQQIAHAEIALIGNVATWCDLEGLDEVSDLLKESLDEAKTFDEILTEIAESEIQVGAVAEQAEEGED